MRHFKCSLCTVVKHSQKELNNHHKSKHGKLKWPDCDESFDTPSGLHRHKYRHRDKKFKCSTCRDQFPFSSQLADHQIWHTNVKPHKCDHENCDKSFKNASSLHKHQLVHDEIKHTCEHADCDYWTYNLRNLSAHLIGHTNKKRYGCEKCGKGFI